ncbi:MAG: hypothetical protein K2K16_03895 [Ruminococcus sp.]|nr:hypothetical protein [Ruminococcus sp.]
MSRQRSRITALPSLIVCRDGTEKELNKLSEKDRNELRLLMRSEISRKISEYYPVHNKEYENILLK